MDSHACDDQTASKQLEVELHRVIKTRHALEFEKLFAGNRLDADYCFTRAPPLIALIQHLVQENFISAVELVLTSAAQSSCSRGHPHHLRRAFDYAARNDLLEILRRFIAAALARAVDCLSLDEAFECAMEKGLYDLAIEVSKDERFAVNFKRADGPCRRRTPLHWAVFCEQPRLLEDFLDRGAIVDAEDRNGLTALALACQMESYDCCRVLLNHGADPNYDSRRRRSADRSTPAARFFSPRYHDFRTDDDGGERNRTPAEEAKVVRILLLMRRAGVRSLGRICEVQRDIGVDESAERRSIQMTENSGILGVASTSPLLTLEEECCRVIRRHLAAVSRGSSIAKRLENLPLPEAILNHSLQLK